MSSPILSQDEINALLQQNISQSLSDDLLQLLKVVSDNVGTWINGVSSQPVTIEGPYIEPLETPLAQSVAKEAVVVAADIGQVELLMLISATDAELLAEYFQASALQSTQMLSQAFVTKIVRMTNAQERVFSAQKVDLNSFSMQNAHTKTTYLARQFFQFPEQTIEFCTVIQNMAEFQSLVGSRRKFLKGNKSPVTPACFTAIGDLAQVEEEQKMRLLEDIDLMVTVELGQTALTLNELLELKPQSVIGLERHAGEPVDLYVNEIRAAKAEVVVLEENFGVRLLEIIPKSQRVQGE